MGGKLTMMAIIMISMIMWMSNDMLTQELLRDGPWCMVLTINVEILINTEYREGVFSEQMI